MDPRLEQEVEAIVAASDVRMTRWEDFVLFARTYKFPLENVPDAEALMAFGGLVARMCNDDLESGVAAQVALVQALIGYGMWLGRDE
jgi:hypothetical protein